ncbi:hyaluronidase-1 [Dicentrarchus labrax]|uniref:hyaluronidase-1 n=1 Tax=Dicentrarchus labrax TaxID=13489 RepID=UPI0021F59E37|nr:hyaluronidase-1 [Dicentrarchus labrax]XP_051270502.1 hyaluronidase-1 [Dicentrarchus labrax]XP_051270503.1 hyaluronidase-1 [Dicentrarchus labrax]XP_051270504.1 hyaluronidase-1 [Dicentrarchus labrax]
MSSFHPEVLLFLKLISLVSGLQFAPSPFSQVPFLTVWNAPTASCLSEYGVDLDLGIFSIVQNQNQTFMGDNITIFYAEKLGLYPRYSSQREAINGGVPQNASLDEHLRVASDNIRTCIPDRDFQGLAVVDWESWRPVWERNWDSKQVYWEGSKSLVRSRHPDWSPAQVDAAAPLEFEEAGRKFMEETLKLGREERPNGLWGYYGFPNCYNYYSDKSANYTGECPAVEKKRNDELLWLWNVSSALYPDIYLSLNLRDLGREVLLYSHHRILEAMRAGAQVTPSTPPVFPYARIVYTYTLDFLSQEHLVYTIGESAALGSAGVVLWGDHAFSKSKATCDAVKSYIDETLGFYLVNVTSAATLCSQTLCSSQGRCQRKNLNSRAYLHLDPAAWRVLSERKPEGGKNYRVLGQLRTHEVTLMKSEFQCKCYQGWGGESCSKQIPR